MRNIIFSILFLFCCLQANSQDYLQSANNCFEKGDYECAKKNYTLFQTFEGKDMSTQIKKAEECLRLLNLADDYFKGKEYEKAQNRYKTVLEMNNKDQYAQTQSNECEKLKANSSLSAPLLIPPRFSFGPLEEQQQFEIPENVEYQIKNDIPWCKTTTPTGLLRIKCLPNIGDSDREDTITLIINEKGTPIVVHQECVKVNLQPSHIDDLRPTQGFFSIQVFSNTPWMPFSDDAWCTVYKTAGEMGFTAVYPLNNTSETRKTRIGVTAGGKEIGINILQYATSLIKTEDWRSLIQKAMNIGVTETYNSGRYKGGFNNRQDGLGCQLWSQGQIYFGEWKAGSREGQAIYIAPEGYFVPNCLEESQFYVGGWVQNKKSGMGSCYDEEGNLIYRGNFEYDIPGPSDTSNISNYAKYKFQLIKYTNNNIYIGETYEGREEGLGMLIYDNSDIWYGQWKNGIPGDGIEILKDGSTQTGYWRGNNSDFERVKKQKPKDELTDVATPDTSKIVSPPQTPVETPPVKTPTVETQPVETPPVEAQPVETPLVEAQPVETLPEFPGGETALQQWLKENLKYPDDAKENEVQGKITVSFIVLKNGEFSDIKVTKKIYPSLDGEAIRLVKSMPQWKPATKNGEAVSATYNLSISFRLD